MATLILSTVGGIVGGPIGAAVGALIGNSIDQAIFAPKGRSGPRIDDLSVQSSAYGAPHPLLFGTVRAAGNVIWSRGLEETAHRSGGGKRSGGRTTTYSYSASFAVAIAGRPIAGIGRIWADGKLLRGASGELTAEGGLRIYKGDEFQLPDPLIVAAEGAASAPAYRGLAYAVFEDLQLGDFANRIPNLSFEVVADAATPSVANIVEGLCAAARTPVVVRGLAAPVKGYAAARNVPLATWIESLSALSAIRAGEADGALMLHDTSEAAPVTLGPETTVAASGTRALDARSAAAAPGAVTLGFLDPARDYQAGLQRAFRASGDLREDHVELPAVLAAADAKRVAKDLLQRRLTGRETARRRVGYRAIALQPGDRVTDETGRGWEVRRTVIEAMTVEIDLEPIANTPAGAAPAEGGRANTEPDMPQGDTHFHVFELPPLGNETPAQARLWIAAGGTGAGWRRAEVWSSRDAGASWSSIGLAGPSALGQTVGALAAADPSSWDEANSVDVDLLSDSWLESRSALSVLAGANLALVGNELVQFRHAEAVAPRRFRLRGLLRGRRATETAAHAPAERFVLIGEGDQFAVDVAPEYIGGDFLFRLTAPNSRFADSPEALHSIEGRSLKPLAPVHLRSWANAGGDVLVAWRRRSRAGFGWIDGADAPIAEDREAYHVRFSSGGAATSIEVGQPAATLAVADQLAAFGSLPASLRIEVSQISGLLGAGGEAAGEFAYVR